MPGTFSEKDKNLMSGWLRLWRNFDGDLSVLPPSNEIAVSIKHGVKTRFTRNSLVKFLNVLQRDESARYDEEEYLSLSAGNEKRPEPQKIAMSKDAVTQTDLALGTEDVALTIHRGRAINQYWQAPPTW